MDVNKKISIAYHEGNKNEVLFIRDIINNDPNLVKINKLRYKNFILFRTNKMQLEYNIDRKEFFITSEIPFSDIEYEKNKPSVTKVLFRLLFAFEENKEFFILLLERPYHSIYKDNYIKYIDMLKNPTVIYSEEDVISLVSILGRLFQENNQGPIQVAKERKLDPSKVLNNKKQVNFIKEAISLFKSLGFTLQGEFEKKLLKENSTIPLNTISNKILDDKFPIVKLNSDKRIIPFVSDKSKRQRQDMYYRPNYLHRFFIGILEELEIDSSDLDFEKLISAYPRIYDYINRFHYNRYADIHTLGLIRQQFEKDFENIIIVVERKHIPESVSYFNLVASRFLEIDTIEEKEVEFQKYIDVFSQHVLSEMYLHERHISSTDQSDYNDKDISVVSDMHFTDFTTFNKRNFSKNFNIIAGDFIEASTFNYIKNKRTIDIKGIGVLGNHDLIFAQEFPELEVRDEIKSGYQFSIHNINKIFPNIKILNNEVYYKNGVAFVGVTLFVDENKYGKRFFFMSEEKGNVFKENYIETIKNLLDSVDPEIPIVLITHAPLKEYSTSKNKSLGIYSEHLLNEYKNITCYIHGHGHNIGTAKTINNIRCVSNPLAHKLLKISEFSYSWEEFKNPKYKKYLK